MSAINTTSFNSELHIKRMRLLSSAIKSYGADRFARPETIQYVIPIVMTQYYKRKQLLASIRYGRKMIAVLVKIEGDANNE